MQTLFTVRAFVTGIAPLSHGVVLAIAFKIGTGDVVKQQVVFQIESRAQPLLEMFFQGLLVRQESIETAVQTLVVDLSLAQSPTSPARRFCRSSVRRYRVRWTDGTAGR